MKKKREKEKKEVRRKKKQEMPGQLGMRGGQIAFFATSYFQCPVLIVLIPCKNNQNKNHKKKYKMAKDPVFQSMFGNRNKEGKGKKKKETDEKTSSVFLLPKRCPPKQNKDEQ